MCVDVSLIRVSVRFIFWVQRWYGMPRSWMMYWTVLNFVLLYKQIIKIHLHRHLHFHIRELSLRKLFYGMQNAHTQQPGYTWSKHSKGSFELRLSWTGVAGPPGEASYIWVPSRLNVSGGGFEWFLSCTDTVSDRVSSGSYLRWGEIEGLRMCPRPMTGVGLRSICVDFLMLSVWGTTV